MYRTLCTCQKTSSHLYTCSTKCKCCCKLSAICNSSGRNNRNIHTVNYLWDKCHSCHLTDMTTTFCSLCNYCISSETLHSYCKRCTRNNRYNHHSVRLPFFHIFSRTSCSCCYNLYIFFHKQFCHCISFRIHKHKIHTKWFIRKCSAFSYVFTKHIRVHSTSSNKPQSACITNCSCKFSCCNISHSALYKRIFYS